MQLSIDPEILKPILEATVAETLARISADELRMGDKLAFNEAEAARLIDLEPHVLRDERLRGRIKASKIVGRRIRYQRSDLLDYLNKNQIGE